MAALKDSRAVFAHLIERHRGRIANTAGDGLIADFPSVVEAVRCAAEVQTELAARNARLDPAAASSGRSGRASFYSRRWACRQHPCWRRARSTCNVTVV